MRRALSLLLTRSPTLSLAAVMSLLLAVTLAPSLADAQAQVTTPPPPPPKQSAAKTTATPQAQATSKKSAAKVATKLQTMDFANYNYGRHMRLRQGSDTVRRYPRRQPGKKLPCRHTTRSAKLVRVHYGDLTGDGNPEALVELRFYKDYCVGRAIVERVLVAFADSVNGVVELARLRQPQVYGVKLRKQRVILKRQGRLRGRWITCHDSWQLNQRKFRAVKSDCTKP